MGQAAGHRRVCLSMAVLCLVGCQPRADFTCATPDAPRVEGEPTIRFEGPRPTNLLFLSIDTLRKDHVTPALMPTVASLADLGVVLEDHVQCSNWTFGGTTCTLAGRSNIERGHIPRLVKPRDPVPAGTPFLATWLGDAGYHSILASPNAWLGDEWGNAQGYDEVHSPGSSADSVRSVGFEALAAARASGEAERWFLHLHFMEPHAPYDPPETYLAGLEGLEPWPEDLTVRDTHYDARGEWGDLEPDERDVLEAQLRVRYAGEVTYLDDQIATTLDTLGDLGLLDDTLVVLWSDHGEAFWEHGEQTHAYHLYGEETDALAAFWARDIVPARHTGPTSAIDLVPTVLQALGLPIPPAVTGLPVGQATDDRPRFAEAMARRGVVQMVLQQGLRLHYRWTEGRVKLFDRTTDPTEQANLYDVADPRVEDLWCELLPQVLAMVPLVEHYDAEPTWPDGLPRTLE